MRRTKPDAEDAGPYAHLLERLALALEEADAAERLRAETPAELELSELTLAELALIRAYLEGDLPSLRGWQVGTERPLPEALSTGVSLRSEPASGASASARRRKRLCCALCGAEADLNRAEGVRACLVCGSELFRTTRSG